MLFDSHIHFFPDKLKGKVLPKLSAIANSPYFRDETLESTLAQNKKSAITHALALHIATNPKQESSVNNFAISCQSENIINFGSVHPESPNKFYELEKIKENGLKGIKLHPDYQEFFVEDKNVYPIYEACQKLGLMIAFHAGVDPYSPKVTHSTPQAIKQVATHFPSLTIIAAHMGAMQLSDDVLEHLVGTENVYLDTAFISEFLDVKTFEKIVLAHGCDKILFGTDSPWSTAETERKIIDSSSLSADTLEKIYFKNAFKLFEIE
ncbi:MAG: amidohydrolase family protein [Clostridia bacterium]